MEIHVKKLLLMLMLGLFSATTAFAASPQTVPVKGMVTMVDLGAKTCIPCKMMAPILVELENEYKGKAAVVFLDVREDDGPARRFGIRAIPTQIFFDKTGKEVARHEGFMEKKAITDQLNKLLAK
ncbi:MAG: thioredoxin [Deltaproteobacteria bacterium HGW-Deltaproteobacteria-8]|jgi:thioredoxin 1|nr:MAG: thioredoxin [Deltaproteobacteria bacterium HGW-Deltaproteobacteria-8]